MFSKFWFRGIITWLMSMLKTQRSNRSGKDQFDFHHFASDFWTSSIFNLQGKFYVIVKFEPRHASKTAMCKGEAEKASSSANIVASLRGFDSNKAWAWAWCWVYSRENICSLRYWILQALAHFTMFQAGCRWPLNKQLSLERPRPSGRASDWPMPSDVRRILEEAYLSPDEDIWWLMLL